MAHHRALIVQPLCSLCVLNVSVVFFLKYHQPQRHRGFTEKAKLRHYVQPISLDKYQTFPNSSLTHAMRSPYG